MKELTENNIDKFSDFFYHIYKIMKTFSNLILEKPIYIEYKKIFSDVERELESDIERALEFNLN